MRFFLALAASVPMAAQTYAVSTVAGGSPAPATAAATSLALGVLGRVATDPAGNIYFSALHSVYRLDNSGTVTRVAGNGRPGFSGDGGPATRAQLNSPQGVAVDTAGNIYIADTGNERIRLVSGGVISTFAGNGTPGDAGDFGDPTQAQLHLPVGLALDSAANLYIADSANNVIREVTGGVITTFAGNRIQGFSHDGESPTVASLFAPTDIVFDTSGDMFIADTGNGRIREVSAAGLISTVVGGGSNYTEGQLATSIALSGPHGIAVDSSGNLYIADADANAIRKVTAPTATATVGTITTLAGTGVVGFAGDGSPAPKALLNTPSSIALDSAGNLYVIDLFNARIRKINSSGSISTVAGNGITAYSGDGGQAQNALMSGPVGVAAGPGGVVYLSDTNNQRVRRIAADGTISTVAGNGSAGFAGDGAAGTSAQLYSPAGLATDLGGSLYIADTGNQRVRKLSGGNLTTVAGNGTSGYAGDGAAAASAQLNSPVALAVDGAGNLYIADFGNHAVRKVSASGTISTLAGTGIAGYSGDNGPANQAQLSSPSGLALDSAGNLYVADAGNHRVRRIDPGGTITTIAGDGNAASTGDGGPASGAELAVPAAVAADAQGNIYIADASANRVRLISPGGLIVTIAGAGTPGYSGDNGPAAGAQFNGPSALSLDASGNLYVADRGNNAIRLLQLIAPVPSAGMVANGASNLAGPIAPGETLTVFGSGIGPAQLTMYQPDRNGNIPLQTGGTTVYVNGVPAPVMYAWTTQVGIIVPYEVTPGSGAITVQYGGQVSLQLPVTIAPSAPGMFTVDNSGHGQAVAVNEDGSTNSTAGPLTQGHVISVYVTGFGLVSPVAVDGSPNSAGFAHPLLKVTATINGQPADVQYAGGDYGLPAGTIRIDIRVPVGISGNAVPIAVQIGAASSQAGVTIAVK